MIPLLALLQAVGSGDEEVFLTRDEAVRIALPRADEVLERRLTLTAAEAAEIRRRARTTTAMPTEIPLLLGRCGGDLSGFAFVQNEIGRFDDITFIVGVGADGRVVDVAVMVYREQIGSDVRRRDFLRQFRGRGPDSRLQRNQDLINITGATMSVDAIARGVRSAIAVVDFLRRNPARLAALQEDPVAAERYVMGTMCRITACGTEEDVQAAFDEIRRWDRILSLFDDESELSRLNAAAGGEATADLLAFLGACREFHDRTGGAFDPTVGPAVRAWGFLDLEYRVPPDGELERLRAVVGWDRVHIDDRRVSLNPGMEIDPGGIGKGWALDRAADVLRARGVTRALLDFRSTAVAMGTWTFQVEGTETRVTLTDRALSTSATTSNRFEREGHVYSHILDPRTLRPVEGIDGVTVIAPTGTAADALSTGFFVLGPERALERCRDGVEALVRPTGGNPVRSSGWPTE